MKIMKIMNKRELQKKANHLITEQVQREKWGTYSSPFSFLYTPQNPIIKGFNKKK